MAPYILDQHGMIRLDRISMPQGRSALSRLFLPCTGVFMGSKVALRSGSGTKLGQRGDGKKELSWYVKAIADMDKNLQETVSPKWRPGCDKFNSAVARLLSPFTRCISSSIDKLADANWPSFVEAGNILPRGYMNHNRSSDRMEPEVPGKSVTDQGYQHAGRDPWQQRFAEKGVYKEHMELLKKSAIVVQHRPHRDKPYSRTYRIRKGPITFLATFYAPWQVPECVKKQLLASDELLWFDQAGSVVMSYSEVELL